MLIKEFASFTGVSVRTLHYYDEIGLLKPAYVDEYTGYRYYNEESLLSMQEILFYRELDFSLKSIKEILSSKNHDINKSLKDQKELLILKRKRLDILISAIDNAMKGENVMKAFDDSELEAYKAEVKKKWGNASSYNEYIEKTKNYSKEKYDMLANEMDSIFYEFALCMKENNPVSSAKAQDLVKKLQSFISDNYYLCTNEMLGYLGKMYIEDNRFMNNIDKHGLGCAKYICDAIEVFVK